MKPQSVEWLCLDESETIGAAELSGACGMSASELAELVDYGALQPLPARGPEHVFSAACVMPLRAAARLRLDFDLDLFAAAVLLGFLDRIEALERQVRSLQAQLPSHAPAVADEGGEGHTTAIH